MLEQSLKLHNYGLSGLLSRSLMSFRQMLHLMELMIQKTGLRKKVVFAQVGQFIDGNHDTNSSQTIMIMNLGLHQNAMTVSLGHTTRQMQSHFRSQQEITAIS